MGRVGERQRPRQWSVVSGQWGEFSEHTERGEIGSHWPQSEELGDPPAPSPTFGEGESALTPALFQGERGVRLPPYGPPAVRGDGDSRVRGDDGTGGWIAASAAMTGRWGAARASAVISTI